MAGAGLETAVATTIPVDSFDDPNSPGFGNGCTLREAINNSNANTDTTGGECPDGSGTVTDAPTSTATTTPTSTVTNTPTATPTRTTTAVASSTSTATATPPQALVPQSTPPTKLLLFLLLLGTVVGLRARTRRLQD